MLYILMAFNALSLYKKSISFFVFSLKYKFTQISDINLFIYLQIFLQSTKK